MKLDQETLKKHHFWVLCGVLVPIFLIGLYGVFDVASASSDKQEKIEEQVSKLGSQPVQGRGLLAAYDKQKEALAESRKKMWIDAWNQQQEIFDRPAPGTLVALKDLSFGDPIPDSDRDQLTRGNKLYRKMYEDIVDMVGPTQFNGGWQRVLRFIPDWKTVPSSEEVWLALEDYWVQRELLRVIEQVNEQVAQFEIVGDQSDKKHRKFRSRLWEVDMKLVPDGPDQTLEATLTNISPRQQRLGKNKTMNLLVYLDPQKRVTWRFPIEGEAVAAGQTIEVKKIPQHTLDPDVAARADGLHGLNQEFDELTVPIRRVDQLALFYPSNRTVQYFPLKMTEFSKAATEPAEGEAGADAGGGFGGMEGEYGAGSGGSAYGPPKMGGLGAMGGVDGEGGMGGAATGSLTDNGLQRQRYIATTNQVRRMPVALVLTLDQAYMQDVLIAFADSRLRFQNTQFHWNRYRGGLSAGRGVFGSEGGSPTPLTPGFEGGCPEDGSFPDEGGTPDEDIGGCPDDAGGGFSGGFSGPRRPFIGPTPMGGGSGYGPPYSGGYGPNQGTMRNNTVEDRSLIQLSLYGTASLYKEYREDAEETDDLTGGTYGTP